MKTQSGDPLLAASAAIFVAELFSVRLWIAAFKLGATQSDRVAIYLNRLPFGLGSLGAIAFTSICIAAAALGVLLAVLAKRSGSSRVLSFSILIGNAVIGLWLIFTLM